MTNSAPALSVVVVTRDTARTLQPILTALGEQTLAGQIEVVIVAPRKDAGTPKPDLVEPFWGWQVVAAGRIGNRGRAAASGVRAARGPFIALSENHCFPDPDWAENTVRFHREEGWDAVGPAVRNANPETTLSVCMHAAGYGLFPADGEGGLRTELPLHNSSFVREALLELDDQLEYLLADERRLHAKLVERGKTLYFEPRVVKWHINEATWDLLRGLAYELGRRYGGLRSRDWSVMRRLGYAAAGPLLSIPIYKRQRGLLPGNGHRDAVGPRLPVVQLSWALFHAMGEAKSYLLGPPAEHPFVEGDEFMIRERLSAPLGNPRIRGLVDRLDD